jgi:hypothetical protein
MIVFPNFDQADQSGTAMSLQPVSPVKLSAAAIPVRHGSWMTGSGEDGGEGTAGLWLVDH